MGGQVGLFIFFNFHFVSQLQIILFFRFWVAALRKGGSCAIITNSCINFVIYCFVGRTFRRRFISTFSWRDNSNHLGEHVAENGVELFPRPGKTNKELQENVRKSCKENYEKPEQTLEKNLTEISLVPISGQDDPLGELERSIFGAGNGVSLPESSRKEETRQMPGCSSLVHIL